MGNGLTQRNAPSESRITGEKVTAGRAVKDIIITQLGAIRPGLKPGRTVIAAALIIENRGCDRGTACFEEPSRKR